jgi:cytochrome c553
MYGGDITMAWTTSADAEYSWNEFYGHTNNCVQCHAVHGAYTLPDSKILKYQGVKSSSTFALQVQPEIYGAASPLYASKADMIAGVLKPAAIADGVTLEDAAVTANCSICHANYSSDNNALINANLQNLQLFQGASWDTPNGSAPTQPWVPGVKAGGWRAGEPPAIWNTFSMKYKNHPMKNADAKFSSPGATGNATDGPVSAADSYYCQSCHNAPTELLDGQYIVQSFPHYTPGYYKFMAALDQSAFATPVWKAEVDLGRIPFFEHADQGLWPINGVVNAWKGPAVMNDGYCTKCHTEVGMTF